jgi:hypothetical protein
LGIKIRIKIQDSFVKRHTGEIHHTFPPLCKGEVDHSRWANTAFPSLVRLAIGKEATVPCSTGTTQPPHFSTHTFVIFVIVYLAQEVQLQNHHIASHTTLHRIAHHHETCFE